MKSTKIITIQIIIVLFCLSVKSQNKNLEFKNINFYEDGKYKFTEKIYVVKGLFTKTKPIHVDSIIDLSSKYIIPALAEGHAHTLDDTQRIEQIIEDYKNEGVYYVWILNNHTSKVPIIKQNLNKHNFPNVLFANGGITHTGNHPSLLIERLNLGIKEFWLPENKKKIAKSRTAENDAYWFFNTIDMFDAKWNRFLKTKPDVVKVYIMDVSNKLKKNNKTLSYDVLKKIVENARKEKIRVVAHIETFDDLKIGIDLGISIYGHLPYYTINYVEKLPEQPTFNKKQLQMIKELKPIIIPTLSLNKEFATKYQASIGAYKLDTTSFNRALKFQKKTIETLRKVGFEFAIGSDSDSVLSEIGYWFDHTIFNTNEILKIATYNTSKLMYPERKINKLQEGFEATFLVLNSDPLKDWNNIKYIDFSVFNGQINTTTKKH